MNKQRLRLLGLILGVTLALDIKQAFSQEKVESTPGDGPYAGRNLRQWVRALQDSRTKEEAAGALRQAGPTLIPKLLKDNKEWDQSAWTSVPEIVAAIGLPAIPAIFDVVRKDPPRAFDEGFYATLAGRTLKEIGIRGIPQLSAAVNDPDPHVAVLAAQVLIDFGPDAAPAVPNLAKALLKYKSDARPPIQEAWGPDLVAMPFARALTHIGPKAAPAVPALIEVAKNTSFLKLQIEAITALGEIGPQAAAAIPTLTAVLGAPSRRWMETEEISEFAGEALGKMGALGSLLNGLKDSNSRVRENAADGLAFGPKVKDPVKPLIAALGDEDQRVRRAAAGALAHYGPLAEEAVPALTKALRDPARYPNAEAAARLALNNIGHPTGEDDELKSWIEVRGWAGTDKLNITLFYRWTGRNRGMRGSSPFSIFVNYWDADGWPVEPCYRSNALISLWHPFWEGKEAEIHYDIAVPIPKQVKALSVPLGTLETQRVAIPDRK